MRAVPEKHIIIIFWLNGCFLSNHGSHFLPVLIKFFMVIPFLYIISHIVVISGTVVPVDEKEVQVSFYQWLSSVTERINQTMHYQFDGSFSFIRSQCDIDVINYLLLWGHFIFTVPGDFNAFNSIIKMSTRFQKCLNICPSA